MAMSVISKIAKHNREALKVLVNYTVDRNLAKYAINFLVKGDFDLTSVKQEVLEVAKKNGYSDQILKVASRLNFEAKSIVPQLVQNLGLRVNDEAIRFCLASIGDAKQIAAEIAKQKTAIKKRMLIEVLVLLDVKKTKDYIDFIKKFTQSFDKRLKTIAWIFLAKHNPSLFKQVHQKYFSARSDVIKRYIATALSYLPCRENVQFFTKLLQSDKQIRIRCTFNSN